jgi:hypothetical protein
VPVQPESIGLRLTAAALLLATACASTPVAAPDTAAAPCTRTVPVPGPVELGPALSSARPGDCLLLADGAYGDLTVEARGTDRAGVLLRARNRLRASVGALRIRNAAFVTVEGLALSTVLVENSRSCRVTRCRIQGPADAYWVRVEEQKGCRSGCSDSPPGTSDGTRIDHCEIALGSTSKDILNPTALSTNTRIDHNYIHDVTGSHVMTVGCCGPRYDYHRSGTIVEYNLWERARPTSAEMVSIKSSAVVFRYNTVVSSGGDVDIRAGRSNEIHGNYLLGGRGIRLYEDDHRIYNNYVVAGLRAGPSDRGHAEVRNALIAYNTILGEVRLSGTGIRFRNNLLLGEGAALDGNLRGGAEALGLVQAGGRFTPTATGPGIGAAVEVDSFRFVDEDIQGKPRGLRPDVGAEQLSPAPVRRRPLTPADVGPDAP